MQPWRHHRYGMDLCLAKLKRPFTIDRPGVGLCLLLAQFDPGVRQASIVSGRPLTACKAPDVSSGGSLLLTLFVPVMVEITDFVFASKTSSPVLVHGLRSFVSIQSLLTATYAHCNTYTYLATANGLLHAQLRSVSVLSRSTPLQHQLIVQQNSTIDPHHGFP